MREFVSQLARATGFELDQTRIDNSKGRWNKAAESSFLGDLDALRQIFSNAVRPLRAVAFEKLAERDALARHPELKDAFDSLRAVRVLLTGRFPADEAARNRDLELARAQIIQTLDADELTLPRPPSQRKPPRVQQPKAAYQTNRKRAKKRQAAP